MEGVCKGVPLVVEARIGVGFLARPRDVVRHQPVLDPSRRRRIASGLKREHAESDRTVVLGGESAEHNTTVS